MTANVSLRTRAARRLAEKLPFYATGHDLEFTDEAVISDMAMLVMEQQYSFRADS